MVEICFSLSRMNNNSNKNMIPITIISINNRITKKMGGSIKAGNMSVRIDLAYSLMLSRLTMKVTCIDY